MQCPLLFEEEWVDPRRRRRRRRRRCSGRRRRRGRWRRMYLGAYPRGITVARSMHNPALRVSVLRVYKAAKRRILAAHAGRALPKGRRTRRRRTRIVCADTLVASAAGFSCVRLVAVIRHVPLAPRIAFAALAVTSEKCCIGNVGQGVIVVGRDNFSWSALVASAAGLLCRFALAILFDLVFAPRRTISARHAGLSQKRPHGGGQPPSRWDGNCSVIITPLRALQSGARNGTVLRDGVRYNTCQECTW